MKRRDFLKLSIAGVGGLCFPWSALPLSSSPTPIRLGIIGLGKHFFRRHQIWAELPGVEVAALCDVEANRLERAGREIEKKHRDHGKMASIRLHRDFRKVLEDPSLNGIVITTPDHWHAYMSVMAMRAGKHVYCEKPLALSIEECRAVARAEAETGKIFQLGLQQRSTLKFQQLVAFCASGKMGRIRKIVINTGGPGVPCFLPEVAPPAGFDWDLWVGPARPRGYHPDLAPIDYMGVDANWRLYEEFGGGQLLNYGVHNFDTARWILGDSTGNGACSIKRSQDGDSLDLRFQNGAIIHHSCGYREYDIEVYGTDAAALASREGVWIQPSDREDELWREPLPAEDGASADYLTYFNPLLGYRGHFQNWLEAVRGRARPLCPASVGETATSTGLLCSIAYQIGTKELHWDGESFGENEQANSLISRMIPNEWRIK